LILPANRVDAWLDPSLTDPEKVKKVLDGIVLEPLDARPGEHSSQQGRDNGRQLIDPLDESADEPLQLTLVAK
jgi:putative SOS response-associated peptidase YedK